MLEVVNTGKYEICQQKGVDQDKSNDTSILEYNQRILADKGIIVSAYDSKKFIIQRWPDHGSK